MLKKKTIISLFFLIPILGMLLTPGFLRAELKSTNVFYAWDEASNRWENGLMTIYTDLGWLPFIHKIQFSDKNAGDLYSVPGCGSTDSTYYAGVLYYGLYHVDNSPLGAPGFLASRDWKLVYCDYNNDGDLDTPVGENGIQDVVDWPYQSGITWIVDPIDEIDSSRCGGNCLNEIVTTIFVNLDTDCNGILDYELPTGGLCFYAEGRKPGNADTPWGGNVQARITVGGGDKTINFHFEPDPTVVLLSSFSARSKEGNVIVEWETVSEFNSAGFYLYREKNSTGEYLQLNKKLLPGLLHSPQGGVYSYVDETAVLGETYTYILEEVEFNGDRLAYGPFIVTVAGEGKDLAQTKSAQLASDRPMQSLFSKKAHGMSSFTKARIEAAKAEKEANKTSSKNLSKTDKFSVTEDAFYYLGASDTKTKTSIDVSKTVKIAVTEDGLYYLDASDIVDVIGQSINAIKNLIKNNKLALTNQGQPVAYLPSSGNDGIYFYGEGIDSIYTDKNIYWLTMDKGLVMETLEGPGPSPVEKPLTFNDIIHVEEDHNHMAGLVTDPESDYWIWDYIISGSSSDGSKKFNLRADGASGLGGHLTLNLYGATDTPSDPDHHVQARLNGKLIGDALWDGISPYSLEMDINPGDLVNGDNVLEVTGVLEAGVDFSIFYVDSFDLSYQRFYNAVDNKLFALGDANPIVTISGFTDKNIMVFDLSEKKKPKLVKAITVDKAPGEGISGNDISDNYRVSFKPASPDTQYLALNPEVSDTPVSIAPSVNTSDLNNKNNRADYLVIAPFELKDAARALVDYRKSQGFKYAMVVDLQDIYDQFSFGIETPHAIKDFLKYAYNNWKEAPEYVVLAGEGTFDYKNIKGFSEEDLVPPLLVATPYGIVASDNQYVDVAGNDGVPEMAIGRLPVVTSEELYAYIKKMAAYEASGGEWTKKVIMAADNPDNGGDFHKTSDEVADMIPASYSVDKVYLYDDSLNETREKLLKGINAGAMLLNYIGHGFYNGLADGLLLTSDLDSITNPDMLPVMTAMTCIVGRFSLPGYDVFGEYLVLKEDGGAIAAWAPSGLSLNNLAKVLDEGFVQASLVEGEKVLGDAIIRALQKYSMSGNEKYIMDIYILLGDPALRMK